MMSIIVTFFFIQILPIVTKLPKADRYVMQETGGDICYQQSRKFYLAYVRQSIIGTIIMSYLTLNCKFDGKIIFVYYFCKAINMIKNVAVILRKIAF